MENVATHSLYSVNFLLFVCEAEGKVFELNVIMANVFALKEIKKKIEKI